VLLITGSSGIAASTAVRASSEGWQVFIVAREQAECEALKPKAPASDFFVGDVREETEVAKAFEACLAKFGTIDAVFHVAGASGRRFGDGPVHSCTLEGWEATFAANALPAFLVSRAAVRCWLNQKRQGTLLNMAIVLAFSPEPTHFATHAYASAKAATIAMSRAMAAQYAPNGIRVNVLAPGLVRTPMSARAQSDTEVGLFIEHKQPLSRGFLEADDIAQTALFLLSEKATHITGQVVTVDGGWTL
jgi:NAD(P)-dependent dehydrogenase (short-subunit alcohol dehydrogenase family)